MVTRSQKIRLGVFIAFALVSILITIIIIVAPKFFEIRDTYFVGYLDVSVTGLQVGGPVKYHGLSVGYISDIAIDKNDIRRVIVEISLEYEVPIKVDTYADITALGITGLMLIELRGGSNDAPYLEPGGYIVPGKSFTELITGQAEVIAEKLEMALNNIIEFTNIDNRTKTMALIENTSNSMYEIHQLLEKNNNSISQILVNIKNVTDELDDLTLATSNTMQNIEKISKSDSLKQIVSNLAKITELLLKTDIVQLTSDFSEALHRTNRVLRELDVALANNRTDLGQSIHALKESAEYLNEFSRLITEDPSVLVRGTKPKNAPDFNLEK